MAGDADQQATLPALVGTPAMAHAHSASVYVLAAFFFGWFAMMPVWIWAGLSGELTPRILSAIAIPITVGLLGKGFVEIRRSARCASEYASRSLGYSIRIGCYGLHRIDAWQRAIWRARVYHDYGIKRPRVIWSTRLEERRLRRVQQSHGINSKASE